MSSLQLTLTQIDRIRAHAERTYPEECCGLLLGTIKGEHKILLEVRETENNWGEDELLELSSATASKRNRFSIAPKILLEVQKEARDRDLTTIGIYHSHPNHAAIPSEFDRAIAHQQYSYIIVSVTEGRATDLRSWAIDEADRFQSEEIVTTD
jgi:proteasome lid subunit RPN8/RPN11